ncbi:MAG: hypothetical protein V3S95_09185, partial [Alphaproteobacteria bacterium]
KVGVRDIRRSLRTRNRSQAVKADAMLEMGEMDGRAVWRRVLTATKELMAAEPEKDQRLH